MTAASNTPREPERNRFPRSLLKVCRDIPIGFAQVMLQPSHLVGLAFMAGLVWNSWNIALAGVVGCATGTLTALALDFPEDERRSGLYGFNGALVGLACAYFYELSLPLLAVVAVGGGASSIVMNRMLRAGLVPLTFPFVAVAWLIFALLSAAEWSTRASETALLEQKVAVAEGLLRGAGQVFFQESLLSGLIFLVAILARDWLQGIYAMLAVALGIIGASVLGFPVDNINLGLFGYNGVLCALLFAGRRAVDLTSAVAAIALSILVVRMFHLAEIPAFTFPFVLSSWIVLWIRGRKWGRG